MLSISNKIQLKTELSLFGLNALRPNKLTELREEFWKDDSQGLIEILPLPGLLLYYFLFGGTFFEMCSTFKELTRNSFSSIDNP